MQSLNQTSSPRSISSTFFNSNKHDVSPSVTSLVISNELTHYDQLKLKRRAETFAEAEQRLKSQFTELGILAAGELTGMCEILFGMASYMQSTRCLENCDVFYILRSSFERLILRRSPKCALKIRELMLSKLEIKNARLKTCKLQPVDLFRSLQYRLETMKPITFSKQVSNHFDNLLNTSY